MSQFNDVRWKQRFNNYCKVLDLLEGALAIKNPDLAQKAGVIQFFEMSFELSWNLLKDYLEEQGFEDIKSPRTAIKKAFEVGIIDAGHDWMDLLLGRNLTSHTYDEDKITEVEILIKLKYYPLLLGLRKYFERILNN